MVGLQYGRHQHWKALDAYCCGGLCVVMEQVLRSFMSHVWRKYEASYCCCFRCPHLVVVSPGGGSSHEHPVILQTSAIGRSVHAGSQSFLPGIFTSRLPMHGWDHTRRVSG